MFGQENPNLHARFLLYSIIELYIIMLNTITGSALICLVGTRQLCWHNNEHNRLLKAASIIGRTLVQYHKLCVVSEKNCDECIVLAKMHILESQMLKK